MANEEQLEILKQGVEVWNKWRDENVGVVVDLSRAKLNNLNLHKANLGKANLIQADLKGADLSEAILWDANLGGAKLYDTNLNSAYLSGAYLREASISGADFSEANLSEVDLQEALIERVNFVDTYFAGCNFLKARLSYSIFGNSDLSEAKGLESIHHSGPSHIRRDVYVVSRGNIPAAFLQGCGLSDWEVEAVKLYDPELNNGQVNQILYKMYDVRASQALQVSPLFISYSHGDSKFVNKIGDSLNHKGIRYWRDIHELKAGRIEKQIDHAIQQNPTVLLVLSRRSLGSDWVEHEVRTARGLEKEIGRDVLCPVTLDGSWKSNKWPKRVMEQIMEYNILDFSEWKDDSKFAGMFRKLIDGLELFYKG